MTTDEVQRLAEAHGFRVRNTKKGLLVLGRRPEDGSVLLHRTESDPRAWKNTRSRLKRLGLPL